MKSEHPIKSVKLIPSGQSIPFNRTDAGIEFDAPRLETLRLIEAVWS
jgi:hypothetical protein